MIFYEAIDALGQTQLLGTQADARAVNRVYEQVDIPVDKAGLREFVQKLYDKIYEASRPSAEIVAHESQISAPLNDYGSVNDLVVSPIQMVTDHEVESVEQPLSYAERSVEIDAIFTNLPVAHQLTLAAIALENARCLC